jgi:hypothetical protein
VGRELMDLVLVVQLVMVLRLLEMVEQILVLAVKVL